MTTEYKLPTEYVTYFGPWLLCWSFLLISSTDFAQKSEKRTHTNTYLERRIIYSKLCKQNTVMSLCKSICRSICLLCYLSFCLLCYLSFYLSTVLSVLLSVHCVICHYIYLSERELLWVVAMYSQMAAYKITVISLFSLPTVTQDCPWLCATW